jgi:hypothetical protein
VTQEFTAGRFITYSLVDLPLTILMLSDDWREPSTFKLPMLAKLKLSDNYRKTLENPGGDSKSH